MGVTGQRIFAPESRVGNPFGLNMRRDAASISRMLNRQAQGKMIGENRLKNIEKAKHFLILNGINIIKLSKCYENLNIDVFVCDFMICLYGSASTSAQENKEVESTFPSKKH